MLKTIDQNLCEFDLELVAETPKAICISDGINEGWIPKSQLEDDIEYLQDGLVHIILPEWLAKNKELI